MDSEGLSTFVLAPLTLKITPLADIPDSHKVDTF